MKVTTKNAVYVQVKDLEFMNNILKILPMSLQEKFFGENRGNYNKYDFVKLKEPMELGFIREQGYLTDYKYFDQKTVDMVIEDVSDYESETEEYLRYLEDVEGLNKQEADEAMLVYKIQNYTLDDLRGILAFKRGEIDIDLPSGNPIKMAAQRVLRAADNMKKCI